MTSQHLETKFNTCNHPRLHSMRSSHKGGESPLLSRLGILGEEVWTFDDIIQVIELVLAP